VQDTVTIRLQTMDWDWIEDRDKIGPYLFIRPADKHVGCGSDMFKQS